MIIANKSLTEHAYSYWAESNETQKETISTITDKLFNVVKENCWCGSLIAVFPKISKYFIEIQVKKGLSAYKVELISSPCANNKRELFSETEKWFIDNKNATLLGNVLKKHDLKAVDRKAEYWEKYVRRYYHREELMVANYFLHMVSMRYPPYKIAINVIKTIFKSQIEKLAITLRRKDDHLYKKFKEFIEDPKQPPEALNLKKLKKILVITDLKHDAKVGCKSLWGRFKSYWPF